MNRSEIIDAIKLADKELADAYFGTDGIPLSHPAVMCRLILSSILERLIAGEEIK